MANKIQITLVKSPIGYEKSQKETVRALGLTRMNKTVEKEDTPAIRGMVAKISHLVEVSQTQSGRAHDRQKDIGLRRRLYTIEEALAETCVGERF